jgi:hypothetical protein
MESAKRKLEQLSNRFNQQQKATESHKELTIEANGTAKQQNR